MTNKNFREDLARGRQAEQFVCDMFTLAGLPSSLETDEAYLPYWDIVSLFEGKRRTHTIKTEVKYDECEYKSGNIAIETYNTRLKQYSGIMKTQAFFWAHVLKDKSVWITQALALKDYIFRGTQQKIIRNGGDGNATLLLYPTSTILVDIFTRIDTLTPVVLKEWVRKEWENKYV